MTLDLQLQRYELFGVNLGLARMQQLLADLGQPQQQMPVIHVAGTNGKGSVCAYLSAVLTQAGYRVGRYTSPHLVDWTERICLNEQAIAPAALEQALCQVEAVIDPASASPTQFEVLTAAAWWYFAQVQVDIAVMEVGLGGRLDATNVCDRPLVSVITSLSREHWQILGPTLAEIAGEKAGILKPGCPAVIGPLPAIARTVVEQRLAALNCPAVWPAPARLLETPDQATLSSLQVKGQTLGPQLWTWAEAEGITYPLPLPGDIQLTNSALAIAVLQILRQQGWLIEPGAIATGMAQTRWPGRMQWFTWQDQTLLVDGAHNPAAAQALRQFVDQQSPPTVTWVIGMLSTKDHRDILAALLRPGDILALVPVPDASSADPEQLATLATEVCPGLEACQTYPDLFTALATVVPQAEPAPSALATHPLTVLCGSLYLIGHFFKRVGVRSQF